MTNRYSAFTTDNEDQSTASQIPNNADEGKDNLIKNNRYYHIITDALKEEEKNRRRQVVEKTRTEEEQAKQSAQQRVNEPESERLAREKNAKSRMKYREEQFNKGNFLDIPLSSDEIEFLPESTPEELGERLDKLAKTAGIMIPDKYQELFRKAKITGLPPSIVLHAQEDKESAKMLDDFVRIKSGGVYLPMNTPTTFKLMDDVKLAAVSSDSVQNLQLIEQRLRFQDNYNELVQQEKIQSDKFGDNVWYGVGTMAALNNGIRSYTSNKFDSLSTGLYSLVASDENAELANAGLSIRQEFRNSKLVEFARRVEALPHETRTAQIAEQYDKNGLWASLKYTVNNADMFIGLLGQNLPSMVVGGPVGKVATKPLEWGLKKTALSTATKATLVNSFRGGVTGAFTSATSYSSHLTQAYEKTGDVNKAVETANKRTAIEAGFGFVGGGFVPKVVKGNGFKADLLNSLIQKESGIGINILGNYAGAKAVGEQLTTGELFANYIAAHATLPLEMTAEKIKLGKIFNVATLKDLRLAGEFIQTVKEMPLTKRDPELAKEVIREIKTESATPIKDFYFPVEQFVNYFNEKGMDPVAVADQVTSKQNVLEEAWALGTKLPIPSENYAVDLAVAGHDGVLNKYLSVTPDSMSMFDISEFKNSLKGNQQKLSKEITNEVAKKAGLLSDNSIFDDVHNQLIGIGRQKQVADHEALIYQSFFNKMADHLDVKPMDLYSKYKLKITKNELENLNTTHTRYAQTGKTEDLFKPLQQDADSYRSNLDRAVNSLVSRNIDIELGNTPFVLQAVGAPDLTLKITRDIVRKAINGVKHDVSMDTIKQLPELLSDPVAILKSRTVDDALVVFVNAKDASNRPVMAAVHFEQFTIDGKKGLKVNKIASIYGRNNAEVFIKSEAENGNLVYVKDTKEPLFGSTVRLQLPENVTPNKGSSKNILTANDIVKYKQTKGGNTNGFIEINQDGTVRINLNKTANLSTFLHETGHFFLHSLTEIIQMPQVNEALKGDVTTIKKWLKVNDLKEITVKHHEQFARGFEAYLMEGKAPSLALKNAFDRFKGWLVDIYRTIRNLNVPLNDDIRQVFDRLLATDDAIEIAKAANKPVFENAADANMSVAEFANYQKAYSKISDQARDKLFSKLINEGKRQKSKEWQKNREIVKAEVTKEISSEPVYKVFDYLTKGILLDGEKGKAFKLDRELMIEQYGKDITKSLKHLTTNENGVSPKALADVFGFNSADEMVKALQSAPNPEFLIHTETEARMMQRYGDTLNDGSITEQAIKSLENDNKAKFLKEEILAIYKQKLLSESGDLGGIKYIEQMYDASFSDEMLNSIAEQVLSNKSIDEIQPSLYLAAEHATNNEAYQAIKQKQYDAAIEAKRRELTNHIIYLKAIELLEGKTKENNPLDSLKRPLPTELTNDNYQINLGM